MSAHFILFKAHAPQGGDKGRVTYGLFLGSQTRKHQAPAPGEFSKLTQDGASLGAQRHKMVEAHFHALRRDAPELFLKVDFRPFVQAHFPRAKKGQRQKLQAALGDEVARVAVYGPQQAAYFLRFGDGGVRW